MTALDSFHLFSYLPAEIRLEVWHYCCSHPRVVQVYYDSEVDQCSTSSPQPAPLHACSESRSEALQLYKPLFGTITHAARIYFHTNVDILYIPRPALVGYDDNARDFAQLATGAAEVVNLALDHVNSIIRRPWETYNKYALMRSFPRVMEVYLVLDSATSHTPHLQKAKHTFLRLAEPAGNPTDICKLLQEVKMSFTCELGVGFGPGDKEEGLPDPPALVLKSRVEIDYLRLL